jgi:FMN-dependent NADH-azoreductase
MTNRLIINGGIRGDQSVSRMLAENYRIEIEARGKGSVKVVEPACVPLQPLDEELLAAFVAGSPDSLSDAQKARLELSEQLIRDVFDADELVISTGMYNFGVSSYLKDFIDHICRAGRTFRYTEAGPEGIVQGKRAVIIVASGGVYSGSAGGMDFVVPYLKAVLNFIGITDVTVVRAEGLAMGSDNAALEFAAAGDELSARV